MNLGNWLGLLLLGIPPALSAGGVFSNSNQSAEYVRTFDRNSALDSADIAYYNMAGTVRLAPGLHLNLSNQTLFQRASVSTVGNPVLGDRRSLSDNPVWWLPNCYAVYRRDRWALFSGLQSLGATATRRWPEGLPSLDLFGKQAAGYGGAASALLAGDAYTAALAAGRTPVQAQDAARAAGLDASAFPSRSWLNGSSCVLAWRFGGAWRCGRYLALAAAGRYVTARQDIAGQVDAACTYNQAGHDLRQRSQLLLHRRDRASGWSGELGVNLYPADSVVLNLTLEGATPLDFTTSVVAGQDAGGLFQDGHRGRLDLPRTWRFGLGYQATPRLRLSLGLDAYLEQRADFSLLALPLAHYDPRGAYGNTLEESGALEYRLNRAWLVSAGFNLNQIGQRRASTLDISLPGAQADYLSLGAGFQFKATERLTFNVGIARTQFQRPYTTGDVLGDQLLRERFAGQGVAIDPRKVYDKSYDMVGIGFNYRIGD